MNADEIKTFLQENLSIHIETVPQNDYYKGIVGYEIKVELLLEREVFHYSPRIKIWL